jgi:hypothetical protein
MLLICSEARREQGLSSQISIPSPVAGVVGTEMGPGSRPVAPPAVGRGAMLLRNKNLVLKAECWSEIIQPFELDQGRPGREEQHKVSIYSLSYGESR